MHSVVLLLFLISGACGLIYEVAWSRLMTQVFGTTALAVGVVLAAFMSGLAAGSYFLGKRGDRNPNPLRLYAYYEIGIALTALGSLFIIDRMVPLYLWAYPFFGGSELLLAGIRFAVAFTVILIPTILMGATLPVLSRFTIRGLSMVGRNLSSLYAINTFGAVAGGVLAGFYLIGRLGIHPTIYIAVAGNLGIGLLAWLASRFTGNLPQAAPGPDAGAAGENVADDAGPGRELYRMLLWAIALSGLTSFAYEVFWTRALVFLFGNSTYAFTMMLTAFLSGIAFGGYLIRFVADRTRSPVTIFAWLEILIGLTSAAALPLMFSIAYSESVRVFLYGMGGHLASLMLSRFAVSLFVMLIPATLIGATFPLVGKICVTNLRQTGREVGTVYAVNTAGNVLGALLPAFIILPLLGIQKGVVLMGALNVCVGGAVLLSRRRHLPGLHFAAPIITVAVAILLMSIPFDYQFPSDLQTDRHRVLFYKEGQLATTKVFFDPETQVKYMSVDSIVIGGTGGTDYKQQLLAHLPKLLLRNYDSELSVGLGSGILVAESLRHDELERVVCVEIEPSVVEGADFFEEETYSLLDDPRLKVVVDDVASFLRTSSESFDIVSSDEKTAEEYASNGFSYSSDYYRMLREHLTPGGLVAQWVPTSLPADQYAMILRTFTGVFPHVSLWHFPMVGRVGPDNSILIGSNREIEFDHGWIRESLRERSEAFHGIRKYGITSVEALLAHHVVGGDILRTATADARLNSLENPYYEFYSPTDYAMTSSERKIRIQDFLASVRDRGFPARMAAGLSEPDASRLSEAIGAESEFLQGYQLQLQDGPIDRITEFFERALELAPWNQNLRYQILPTYWNLAMGHWVRGDHAMFLQLMDRAVATYQDNGEVHYYHGLALMNVGRTQEAVAAMTRAIELAPKLIPPRVRLTLIFMSTRQNDRALEQLRAILEIDPDNIFALVQYGMYMAQATANYHEAGDLVARAYRLAPDDPSVIDAYAWVAYMRGDRKKARAAVREGGDYYAGQPAWQKHRETILGGRR